MRHSILATVLCLSMAVVSVLSYAQSHAFFTTYPTTTDKDGSYTLAWHSITGRGINFYINEYKNGTYTQRVAKSGTSVSISGRGDGTYRYDLWIRQRYWNGSEWVHVPAKKYDSVTVTVLKKPNEPSLGGSANNDSGTYTLSWGAASGTVAHYKIFKELNNSGNWTSAGTSRSTAKRVSGLTTGQWDFKVKACNATGCGGYSGQKRVNVAIPPNTPPSISFDATTVEEGNTDRNGIFRVKWGASSEPPLVSGYQLCQAKDGVWESATNCPKIGKSSREKSIPDSGKLTNGSYRYRVRAYAKAGTYFQYSTWRYSPTVTVNRKPDAVTYFSQPSAYEVENEVFTVAWSEPTGAFDPVDDYELQWSVNGAGFVQVPDSEALDGSSSWPIQLPKGSEGTYKFRARAHNSQGWGPWTPSVDQKEVSVKIPYDAPGNPAFFNLPESSEDGDYSIDWLEPNNGVFTYFELQEERLNDPNADPNCLTAGQEACWALVATTDADTTEETFGGRAEDKYRYRVRACNPDECSEWATSNWISVYNLEGIVPAVGFTPANAAGSTPYTADVNFQGDATVTIPVQAAPGVNGLEPNIAIRYSGARYRERQNEALPEDILGYGWRLSGFSEIRRCVIGHSNDDTIQLDENDSLCLDGEPLVLVGGTDWQAGARYRTLRETFQLIQLQETDGKIWFRVYSPDGRISEYGSSPDSRLRVGDGAHFAWSIKRVTDPFGNNIDYNYHRSTIQGINYPLEILYGNAGDTRIEFQYGTRTDAPPQPLVPGEIDQEQLVLLHHINVYRDWNGDSGLLVRDYRLITEEEPTNPEVEHYRRLTDVQLCGYGKSGIGAQCLPPLSFEWMEEGEQPLEPIDAKMGIEQVTDSLGKVTAFEHTLMVEDSQVGPYGGLFTERPFGTEITPAGATPLEPINGEYRYVVTKVSRSNGLGGMHQTEYRYQGVGYMSDNHWGFLGYAAQKVHDIESGIVTYRQFRLDFPHFAKVARLQQYQGSYGSHAQVLTSQQFVHSDFVLDAGANNTHYPATSEALESIYEWDKDLQREQLLGYRRTTTVYDKADYSSGGTLIDGELISGVVRTHKTATGVDFSTSQSYWGEVLPADISGIQRSSDTTISFDNRVGASWLVGFVDLEQTRHFDGDITGEPDQVQTVTATPYANSNNIDVLTRFPDDPDFELVVDYAYDGQGNLTGETTSGANIETRSTSASNFLDKRYPQTLTNALEQSVTLGYDERFGSVSKITDANNRVVKADYDPFGRESTRTNADSVVFTTTYSSCVGGSCTDGGALAALKVSTNSPITPATDRYYDKLGRLVRQYMASFGGGERIRQEYDYNPKGQLYLETLPFYENDDKSSTIYGYDLRNRVTSIQKANGGHVGITYKPLPAINQVQVIVKEDVYASADSGGGLAETQERHSFYDLAGDLLKTVDGVGATDPNAGPVVTTYDYYGSGLLKSVMLDENPATESSFTYYDSGLRETLTDPNLGTVTTKYDALGQLVEQKDNKQQITNYWYDKLGRLEKQTDADGGIAEWHYDPHNGVGALDYRSYTLGGIDIFRETHQYNAQAKPDTLSTILTAGGETRSYQHDYSYYGIGDGRLQEVTYPGGSVAHYDYSGAYLSAITDGSIALKTFNRLNAFGQVEEEVYGNNVVTIRNYDPTTGRLESIDTAHTAGTQIQDNQYRWRSNGTLESRLVNDGGINRQEDFTYDALSRLTEAKTLFDGVAQRTLTTQYNKLGNITAKTSSHPGDTEVTGYQYGEFGNAGPNAVSDVTIGNEAYSLHYDLNGAIEHYNAASGSDKWVTWNARQLPMEIVVGDSQFTAQPKARDRFQYGPNGQRFYRETSWWDESAQALRTEKAFILGNYEDQLPANDPDYQRIQKTRIDDNVVHIVVTDNLGLEVGFHEYVHRDHLGSVEKVTRGEDGSVIDLSTAFDPDGRRRSPDWSGQLQQTELKQLLETQGLTTRRGFTGHEHLDRTGLIHMNGRIYDPALGRFLSPDPIVQAPAYSQSWNRYTYTFNNPLAFTDPTGYKSNDAKIQCVGDCGQNMGPSAGAGLSGGFGLSRIPTPCRLSDPTCDPNTGRSVGYGVLFPSNNPGGGISNRFDGGGGGVSNIAEHRTRKVAGIEAEGDRAKTEEQAGSAPVAQEGINPVPPYRYATYPGAPGTPVHIDPNSVTATSSDWNTPGVAETSVWGAFKAVAIARGAQLFGFGTAASSTAGAGASGATMENLTLQVRTTTYTANVSDWNGTVYFGLMGDVKAIDFHGLSNTRTMVLEVARTYRVMAGSTVVYTSSPETVSMSRVSDFIPSSNGYPIHDVVY